MTSGMSEPAVSLSEAQGFVRVETGEEEAILAGLIRTASALCEAFLNQVVIARAFSEDLPLSGEWQRLLAAPVRSIGQVQTIGDDGTVSLLPVNTYAVDIDSAGDGWVRVISVATDCRRVRIAGVAGMATEANAVPEPIRQGVLRLVAY
ncbi:MAG: hypothetical protein H0V46_04655, partial [Sphingomonas sp.]|nr:hypothetical protein [Sphingomonas sp.]